MPLKKRASLDDVSVSVSPSDQVFENDPLIKSSIRRDYDSSGVLNLYAAPLVFDTDEETCESESLSEVEVSNEQVAVSNSKVDDITTAPVKPELDFQKELQQEAEEAFLIKKKKMETDFEAELLKNKKEQEALLASKKKDVDAELKIYYD